MPRNRPSFDESLLSAYLDGELKAAERAQVEAALQQRPELQAKLNDLQALRKQLRSLQSIEAPADFRERVLQRLTTDEMQRSSSALNHEPTVVTPRAVGPNPNRWLRWCIAASSIAAAVMFTILWWTPATTPVASRRDSPSVPLYEPETKKEGDSTGSEPASAAPASAAPAVVAFSEFSHDSSPPSPLPPKTDFAVHAPELEKLGERDTLPSPPRLGAEDSNRSLSEPQQSAVALQSVPADQLTPELNAYVAANHIQCVLAVSNDGLTRGRLWKALANNGLEIQQVDETLDPTVSANDAPARGTNLTSEAATGKAKAERAPQDATQEKLHNAAIVVDATWDTIEALARDVQSPHATLADAVDANRAQQEVPPRSTSAAEEGVTRNGRATIVDAQLIDAKHASPAVDAEQREQDPRWRFSPRDLYFRAAERPPSAGPVRVLLFVIPDERR